MFWVIFVVVVHKVLSDQNSL